MSFLTNREKAHTTTTNKQTLEYWKKRGTKRREEKQAEKAVEMKINLVVDGNQESH